MSFSLPRTILTAAKSSGTLTHAYLFFGASMKELLPFAEEVVRILQCEAFDVSSQSACGLCRYCKAAGAGYMLDLYRIRLEEKSEIGIDQVRSFIRELSQTSSGGTKIGIIQDGDLLSHEAAEALLKVIEEPVGDTVILVLAQNKHALPETILSRCQLLYCSLRKNETDDEGVGADFTIFAGDSLYQKTVWAAEVAADEQYRDRLENLARFMENHLIRMRELATRENCDKIMNMLNCLLKAIDRIEESPSSRRMILEVCVLETIL